MTTLCLHCDASLTRKDLDDGWCDSCGKKLPFVAARETRRDTPRKKADPAAEEPMSAGKAILAVLVVVLLTYFATRVYLGDRASLALFMKVGVKAMVVFLIAIPFVVARMLRARS